MASLTDAVLNANGLNPATFNRASLSDRFFRRSLVIGYLKQRHRLSAETVLQLKLTEAYRDYDRRRRLPPPENR